MRHLKVELIFSGAVITSITVYCKPGLLMGMVFYLFPSQPGMGGLGSPLNCDDSQTVTMQPERE